MHVILLGIVGTLAGSGFYSNTDGIGSVASFRSPSGIAVASNGVIFVADADNNKIRMISTSGIAISKIICIVLFLTYLC